VSGARPESMRGTGTNVQAPIPIRVSVGAQHYDPSEKATSVSFM
jgi:hypothetical protein